MTEQSTKSCVYALKLQGINGKGMESVPLWCGCGQRREETCGGLPCDFYRTDIGAPLKVAGPEVAGR